jgi:hypothetical protein
MRRPVRPGTAAARVLGIHVVGEEQPDQDGIRAGHHHPGHLGMAHPVRQGDGILTGSTIVTPNRITVPTGACAEADSRRGRQAATR